MTAHEFYLAAGPWREAVQRAQRHGWRSCDGAFWPSWGPVLMWHPRTAWGLEITPLGNGRVAVSRV